MTQFINVRVEIVEIEEDVQASELRVEGWKVAWEESFVFDEEVQEKEACFLARVMAKAVVKAGERGKEMVISLRKQGSTNEN